MKLITEKPALAADIEPVECMIVKGNDFGDVWHHHPACEITLVRRGGSERWIGDKLEALNPGDLVFLGPDLPHDYRNAPLPDRRTRKIEAVVIHFMPQLLGDSWLSSAYMDHVRRLFDRARRGLRVGEPTRSRAESLMLAIFRQHGIKRMMLLLELLDLLATSKRLSEISSDGFSIEPTAYSSDRIGVACEHIEKNLASPLRVPELAQQIGLSESAFSRLFKKCTGGTVPQYVNRLRIAHACRLLAETDKTVSEIVRLCGYNSPAHFQRQFQRIHKYSPQGYREKLRQFN
ncbi:MAG: AraC family transcriptional regulator [Kiritimatiellae bacterium]|nr:AraC family transcriptional regulator [Kiritimatiellia bacterium]